MGVISYIGCAVLISRTLSFKNTYEKDIELLFKIMTDVHLILIIIFIVRRVSQRCSRSH